MKSIILTVALSAFAGLCAAQGQASLPPCAQACVVKFTLGSSIGGCQSQDVKCICSAPTFLSGIACCLAGACGPEDQQEATRFAKDYCELSGVTNLPTAVVCASTATQQTSSTATGGSSSPVTPAPSVAATVTSAPASSSTPNAGAQNAAGVGAGFGMLALAALL